MNSHDETNTTDPAATTGEVSNSLAPDGSNPKPRSFGKTRIAPIFTNSHPDGFTTVLFFIRVMREISG